MLQRALTMSLVIGLIGMATFPAFAQDGNQPGAAGIQYLLSTQNDDGGFSNGFSPESDISTTADVVVAMVSAGQDPRNTETSSGQTSLSFLVAQVEAGNLSGAGQIAKVIIALVASGEDPTAFAGKNLVEDLLALQGEDGLFGMGPFDHCLTMIALQNTHLDLPDGTVEAAIRLQTEDGGWAFMEGQPSDTNTTGLCLQALSLTEEAEAIAAGLVYLAEIQNEDGGWPYQNPSDYGTDSDTNSTALILQALLANGENLEEWGNPQEWLLSMQMPEGAFMFQQAMPFESVLATVAVIPALEGMPLNVWALPTEAE